MSHNIYSIIKIEAFSDRPEVMFTSTSKAKIDAKLEDLYLQEREIHNVFDYEEGDCLILESDDAYYIEKTNNIL